LIYEEDYEDISHTLKRGGVDVIGHELAHQFFGDAVTCEWWSYTWLNEGYATMFSYLITDILYPEWNSRHFFNLQKLQNAFRFDSTDATRSMTFEVATLAEISASFDTIGYDKCEYFLIISIV
jgi:aminopeptidase N